MDKWSKEFKDRIDQREEELPPLWQSRDVIIDASEELNTQGIHRSGKKRKLANLLCGQINEAQEMVVVSSFLMADVTIEESILDAAKRGVRVYLLLAAETRLESEPKEDSEFDNRVFEEHKKMLNRLAGWVLIRSASNLHAKVLLIDPKLNDCFGILLTANLTKEALERNEELAVELNTSQVKSIFELLRWVMWEGAEHELLEQGRLQAVKPLNKIEAPDCNNGIFSTTAYNQTLREEVIRVIKSASSNLIISSFGWEKDHQVLKLLCDRMRDGLTVTLLARVRPAAMPALEMLCEAGALIHGFDWLHAKAIWSDSNEGLILTANFETHGLDEGFEMGVALHNGQCVVLEERLRDWVDIAPWELLQHPKLGDVKSKVKIWSQNHFIDDEILEEKIIPLGNITAESAEKLDGLEPDLPVFEDIPELAYELIATWTVSAPTFNSKYKEMFRKKRDKQKGNQSYDPPVYRTPDGKLVVAVKEEREIPRALEVKKESNADSIVAIVEK